MPTTQDIVTAFDAAMRQYDERSISTRGGTLQTRRIITALRLIGLKRSDFRARVERIRRYANGSRYVEYGDASASIWSPEGQQMVIDNAETLTKCGISVHIIEGEQTTTAFVSSSYPYRITRYNVEANTVSYEYPAKEEN